MYLRILESTAEKGSAKNIQHESRFFSLPEDHP